MSDDRVRLLIDAVIDGVTAAPAQVQGLARRQIDEIEGDQVAPLAATYRRFLALAGGGAGRFLQGSDVFYPQLLGLGQAALELLRENNSAFVLTGSDRVFFMHQGYQFAFLRGEHDDPEVWFYCESFESNEPVMTHASFTDWLHDQVKEQVAAWARLVPEYEAEKLKPPGERRLWYWRRQSDGAYIDEM